ncbi:MAG: DUF4139 domain-containing protein [Anaerolineae bacterium]|nr:DUF4139 domain-containing protein [Anaerolineae bacterium]
MSAPPVTLAIYNQGSALVKDRRMFDIQAGQTTLDFTDVASGIEPSSVSFVSISDPDGTFVLEQNYVFDLVNAQALLKRYLGETIELTLEDGDRMTGQLLNDQASVPTPLAPAALLLRCADGQVVIVQQSQIRDMRFPALPEGLVLRPTLRWLLRSARAGSQEIEVTYLTDGMNWTADYNVLLARDNQSLNLNGWVTLTNTSGATYTDALVKLVAGEVKRVEPKPQPVRRAAYRSMDLAANWAEPQVEQREIFEYNLYELTRRVTVANKETKQVEFVTGQAVPATTHFVYDAQVPVSGYGSEPFLQRHYDGSDHKEVQVWLEFSTGEENGLGADMPAGTVRVYQKDMDGAALLIGENRIKHTPKGEQIKLLLGAAFDLVGERKQTDFTLHGSRALTETYEIRLRNRKDNQPVMIRVPERLFRWSNWMITDTTHEFTQVDSRTIQFEVEVPPQGETVVTYTVRYEWPKR